MKSLGDHLRAGLPIYRVEVVGADGFVLVRNEEKSTEFAEIVRNLMDYHHNELVVLPASDGKLGYMRAIILPL